MISTVDRVPLHTSDEINRRIQNTTEDRVRELAKDPERIDRRLRELDEEWDVERLLEANASTLAFAGVVMAATVDKRWLILPGVVTAFLLQHAIQGWCPPIPIIRRLGYRTAREIEIERVALKALRGDFEASGSNPIDSVSRASRALGAARR
jgi:hypothetical protein